MTTDSTREARIVPGEASAEMIEAAIKAAPIYWHCGDAQKDLEREQFRRVVQAALDAATPSAPPADMEAESRELLAAEVASCGSDYDLAVAERIRDGSLSTIISPACALRAIQRALSARQIAQGVIVRADILRAAIREADRNGPSQLGQALQDALDRHSVKPPSVEADAIVERLLVKVPVGKIDTDGAPENGWQLVNPDGPEAAALITRLSGGEVERLREALEPFARAADAVDRQEERHGDAGDDAALDFVTDLKCGDLRRARTAIQGESRD